MSFSKMLSTLFENILEDENWTLGRGFKLKKYFWIIAIPKFDVPMYIKMESTFPNQFWGDLHRGVGPSNIYNPLNPKKKRFFDDE